MSGKRVPFLVMLTAGIYIAVGIGGFIVHINDSRTPDWIWIEATEFLALTCGVFMLRALNWARWLATAWMAFHVVLSFDELPQLAIHSLLFLGIVWCLFRADARRFFQNTRPA